MVLKSKKLLAERSSTSVTSSAVYCPGYSVDQKNCAQRNYGVLAVF